MRNNSYNLFNTIIHNNNVIEYRRETRDKRVIRKIKYVNGRARIERERERDVEEIVDFKWTKPFLNYLDTINPPRCVTMARWRGGAVARWCIVALRNAIGFALKLRVR